VRRESNLRFLLSCSPYSEGCQAAVAWLTESPLASSPNCIPRQYGLAGVFSGSIRGRRRQRELKLVQRFLGMVRMASRLTAEPSAEDWQGRPRHQLRHAPGSDIALCPYSRLLLGPEVGCMVVCCLGAARALHEGEMRIRP
jgi:hypothetical protein